jgi:hypothetical protein
MFTIIVVYCFQYLQKVKIPEWPLSEHHCRMGETSSSFQALTDENLSLETDYPD